jgi:hypothetical protein
MPFDADKLLLMKKTAQELTHLPHELVELPPSLAAFKADLSSLLTRYYQQQSYFSRLAYWYQARTTLQKILLATGLVLGTVVMTLTLHALAVTLAPLLLFNLLGLSLLIGVTALLMNHGQMEKNRALYLCTQINLLEAELNQSIDTFKTLTSQLMAVSQQSQRYCELLQGYTEQVDVDVCHLQTERGHLQTIINDLKQTKDIMGQRTITLDNAGDALVKRLTMLTAALHQENGQVNEVTGQLDSVCQQLIRRVTCLQHQHQALDDDYKTFATALNGVQNEQQQLKAQLVPLSIIQEETSIDIHALHQELCQLKQLDSISNGINRWRHQKIIQYYL